MEEINESPEYMEFVKFCKQKGNVKPFTRTQWKAAEVFLKEFSKIGELKSIADLTHEFCMQKKIGKTHE